LHGDLSQSQRDHVMKRFREKTLQMLVATDVAARGIDVNDISHIINYNLPEDNEGYTHRSGRTGRAGKSGVSIAIVNFREINRIPQIEKNIRKKFEKLLVPTGAEICEKQLFKLIDRMENVEVDEDQIAPFMNTVNKKLEWLSKEQIIKHFLSLEFNRFLEYYKNAPDLNDRTDNRRERRDRSDFRDNRANRDSRDNRDNRASRDSRDNRDNRANRDSRDNRDNRANRDSRDNRENRDRRGKREDNRSGDRQIRVGKTGYTRFFINIGKKDDIDPKVIIGMINDNTQDRDINIGSIDLKDNFSFFEVGEESGDKVLKSFNNSQHNGRRVVVEIAEKDVGGRNKGKRKKK
ncbi:helicase-related protein, partial [Bacteroidota bacterium]